MRKMRSREVRLSDQDHKIRVLQGWDLNVCLPNSSSRKYSG